MTTPERPPAARGGATTPPDPSAPPASADADLPPALPDRHAPPASPDAGVLQAFGLARGSARPATSGLINRTWYVRSEDGEALVLQRVNAIFPPAVNHDIDVLTSHIAAKGLLTPRLVPNRTGALWIEHHGAVWRVLTHIDGVTREALETAHQAREAGRLLAAFHCAVADLDHPFVNARLGVHDTAAHLRALRRTLSEYRRHAAYAAVRPLAREILALADALPELETAPDRVVHGDPKISNILFERETDRALCLVDLDTLARMPVALELGDAMRSWCNPAAEDTPGAAFSLPLFEAAVAGYAEGAADLLSATERRHIVDATLAITLELAARFCADALEERYFAWDPARYPSASAHNHARARGQLDLAMSIRARLVPMRAAVDGAFATAR